MPRHVQRAKTIARQLERCGLRYTLFSMQQSINPETQVLIYDRMGYLFPIMSITDMVFMGGTHDQKIGGHNLYEPAVMGKLIVGGPYYNNFPDIGSELEETGVYHQVLTSRELVDFAKRLQNMDLQWISENALRAVSKRKGSVSCILDQIHRFIG